MVMNTSFGDVNYLPFDLRHRRITQYCVTKAEQPKSDKKNRLQKILVDTLRAIFEENLSVSVIEPVPSFINQDKVLFEELLEALPSAGSIQFINENNMAGFSFDPARLNDLYKFAEEWKDAEHEFLDEELEQDRQHLHSLIQQYLYEIAKNTFSVGGGGLQSVPEEWEITQPKRFSDTVQLLHSLAGEIVDAHQAFIRKGRRKFSV